MFWSLNTIYLIGVNFKLLLEICVKQKKIFKQFRNHGHHFFLFHARACYYIFFIVKIRKFTWICRTKLFDRVPYAIILIRKQDEWHFQGSFYGEKNIGLYCTVVYLRFLCNLWIKIDVDETIYKYCSIYSIHWTNKSDIFTQYQQVLALVFLKCLIW